MSVIAEISIPSEEFELGRLVDLSQEEIVELESLVPAGDRAVPYLWVYDVDYEGFEEDIVAESTVEHVEAIDTFDDRALYTVEWAAAADSFFSTVRSVDAYVLSAMGTCDAWTFELRFPSHEAMSTFQERCRNEDVDFDVLRVYNPNEPEFGPWFGLTDRQHEALVLAVESGYYDIPRTCTTIELADELGISDQAVTERLRRAIDTLTRNTILSSHRG